VSGKIGRIPLTSHGTRNKSVEELAPNLVGENKSNLNSALIIGGEPTGERVKGAKYGPFLGPARKRGHAIPLEAVELSEEWDR